MQDIKLVTSQSYVNSLFQEAAFVSPSNYIFCRPVKIILVFSVVWKRVLGPDTDKRDDKQSV